MADCPGRPPAIENALTQMQVTEWVSQGASRQECMNRLQEMGLSYTRANVVYYAALKDLAPDPNLLDDYKRGIIQQNMDRLEKIIEESIDGNYQSKTVALKAIDTVNKMLGIYNESNKVTIAQKEGEQVIQIDFTK